MTHVSAQGSLGPPSRRERVRAATLDEIKQAARQLLVSDGPAGISLRAIGREMGMTAAALYRYYPSLGELVESLCADLYDECAAYLEAVRDVIPDADPGEQLLDVCRAFRIWSIEHPREFGLMFGTPVPGADEREHELSDKHQAAMRFANLFAGLFSAIWIRAPFPVAADDEIPRALAVQLERYIEEIGAPLPVGAVQVFLSCWIRLYGLVALEVHGHLHFALTDGEPMFEAELKQAAQLLGLTGC